MKRFPLLFAAAILALFALPGVAAADGPQVSTGTDHTCAVSDTGAVSCWGANDKGQVGDGSTSERTTPVAVSGLPSIRSVAAGEKSTCALAVSNSVWCWGANQKGQLAQGAVDNNSHPTPTRVPGLDVGMSSISGGTANFCVLLVNGEGYCWGGNAYGEIGTPLASNPQMTPIKVAISEPLKGISAGYSHSCAVLTDGRVKCWGYNASGAIGDNSTSPRTTPVFAQGIGGVTEVYAGGYTTCARDETEVWCWGGSGMIGNGSDSSLVPVMIAGPGSPAGTKFAIGGQNANNCFVRRDHFSTDGSAWCWGSSLPNGSPDVNKTLTQMPLLGAVIGLSGNGFASHNCAVRRGGSVVCWGYNSNGQLGNGATSATISNTPSLVPGVDLVQGVYPATSTAFSVLGTPKADKKRKTYKVYAGFTLGLPNVVTFESCTGTVNLSVAYSYKAWRGKKGKRKRVTVKKKVKGSAQLAPIAGNVDVCSSKGFVKLPVSRFNGKWITVAGSYAGNGTLAPVAQATSRVKLKHYKIKKKSSIRKK